MSITPDSTYKVYIFLLTYKVGLPIEICFGIEEIGKNLGAILHFAKFYVHQVCLPAVLFKELQES